MAKESDNYISLQEAAKYCYYSQEYLSLRARQGKLKAVKFGRNWVTKKEWLEEYLKNIEEYNNNFKAQKIAVPPKNLPIAHYQSGLPSIKSPVPLVRFGFITALVFVLLAAGCVFGKESFKNVYRDIEPYTYIVGGAGDIIVEKTIKVVADTISDIPQSLATVSLTTASIGDTFKEYGQWLARNTSEWFSFQTKEIAQNYFAANELVEEKLSTFEKQITEGGKGMVETVKGIPQIVTQPFKEKVVVEKVAPEITKKEIEELKTEIEKLKKEPVIVKEVEKVTEVTKITKVEPIKEITKETIITKIDEEELTKLKTQITQFSLWGTDIEELRSITQKLQARAPQAIYSPTIINTRAAPVIPIQEAGSGNVVLSATNTLQFSGQSVNIQSPLTAASDVTILGTFTVGTDTLTIDTLGNLSTTGNITTTGTGDLTVAGDLSVAGTQTFTGEATFATGTFTGNLDAQGGLDVTGDSLTVGDGGAQFTVTTAGVVTGGTYNLANISGGTLSGGTLSGGTYSGTGITPTGAYTIGNNTTTITIDSSNWGVSSAGAISGATGISFSGAGTAQIQTAASQDLALMPGGDVGIGTATPGAKLDVRQDTASGKILSLYDLAQELVSVADGGVTTFKPAYFDYVVRYNGSSFEDPDTTEAKSSGGTAFTILSDNNDYFYVGLDHKFDSIYFDIATALDATNPSLTKQYYSTDWTALTVTDNTSVFTQDGTITFTAPSNWATTEKDGQTKYWVRFAITYDAITTGSTAYVVSPTTGSRFSVYAQSGDTNAALSINDTGTLNLASVGDNHLYIKTDPAYNRNVRINSQNYSVTSGDIIGFQTKPAANADGTASVYGAQIQPRFNADIGGNSLIGLNIEPIIKGTPPVGTLSGNLLGIEVALTDENQAGKTISGITASYYTRQQLAAHTFSDGPYGLYIKQADGATAWKGDVRLSTGGIIGGTSGDLYIDSSGNVGIGTTSPDRKLDVLDAGNPQLRLSQTDSSVYVDFQVANSTGDLTITMGEGENIILVDDGTSPGVNLWVCHTGDCPTPSLSDYGNLVVEGKIEAVGGLNIGLGEALEIDGSAGTSDQFLKSQGTGASPVWDNLAASDITSGRFGKSRLEWTADKILVGDGDGADPTEIDVPVTATKEFFVPATYGTEMGSFGNHAVVICNAANDYGYISIYVPYDFSSITSAVIIVIPMATQSAADWDINASYGAAGESCNEHVESDAASTYNVTQYVLFEVDISGILSALAAGDKVGIRLKQATAGHDVNILGVRFRYN